MSQQTSTGFVAVTTVTVPSRDQDAALAFYTGTLGFAVQRDATFGAGFRWIEVAPPGSAATIALAPTPPDHPVGVDTGIRLSVTDADAVHARLKEAGTDVDDVMRWGGPVPPMFSFRDPDGNTLYAVEIVEGD
jgi:catechol 2,3-dioxygenase-like lactoylglutathione lyase family enzyme